jgi:hypothetical protein
MFFGTVLGGSIVENTKHMLTYTHNSAKLYGRIFPIFRGPGWSGSFVIIERTDPRSKSPCVKNVDTGTSASISDKPLTVTPLLDHPPKHALVESTHDQPKGSSVLRFTGSPSLPCSHASNRCIQNEPAGPIRRDPGRHHRRMARNLPPCSL